MQTVVDNRNFTLVDITDFLGRVSSIGRRILILDWTLNVGIFLTIFNVLMSALAVWAYYGQLELVPWVFDFFLAGLMLVIVAVVLLGIRGLQR
jgi:uncharacterized membrane protein YbhN (UPF0104 family)